MAGMILNDVIGASPYKSAQQQAAEAAKRQQQAPYVAAQPSPQTAGAAMGTAFGNAQGSGAGYSVDPYGYTSYNDDEEQRRRTLRLQSELEAQNAQKRLDAFKVAMSGGGPDMARVDKPSLASNEQDARAQVFARAKDQAAKIARASLDAITEQMAGRGISGSGIEALRGAGAIQDASQPLLDLNASQAASDVNRAADITDMTYQGDITQRGQDLANRQSYLQLVKSLLY